MHQPICHNPCNVSVAKWVAVDLGLSPSLQQFLCQCVWVVILVLAEVRHWNWNIFWPRNKLQITLLGCSMFNDHCTLCSSLWLCAVHCVLFIVYFALCLCVCGKVESVGWDVWALYVYLLRSRCVADFITPSSSYLCATLTLYFTLSTYTLRYKY